MKFRVSWDVRVVTLKWTDVSEVRTASIIRALQRYIPEDSKLNNRLCLRLRFVGHSVLRRPHSPCLGQSDYEYVCGILENNCHNYVMRNAWRSIFTICCNDAAKMICSSDVIQLANLHVTKTTYFPCILTMKFHLKSATFFHLAIRNNPLIRLYVS
jgi:hypothetical protein